MLWVFRDLLKGRGIHMDANECDMNHLDADVLLPPRKRLLAGLKKQNCSNGTSQCLQENNVSPSTPLLSPNPLSEFDVRLSNLLKSYKNGSNMSPEEIAEAAKSAASSAAKAAEVAKAAAEEKAAMASKAVAAAKNALDLVASMNEEISSRDRHQKKNKLKKQIPVQLLYKKYQPIENCGTDEELARRLHRAMNSSPRISKNHKHKKLKISPLIEKSDIANGIPVRDGIERGVDCEGSNQGSYTVKVDDKVSKSSKIVEVEVHSGEGESSHSKEKTLDISNDMCISGRKRGRIKQKKLPLSICSFKDQANTKEEVNRTDKSTGRHTPLLSVEPPANNVTAIEVAQTWKCHDFKVSQCIKQDKVVQS